MTAEHIGRFGFRKSLVRRVGNGVPDDEHTVGTETFIMQKLGVEFHGRQMHAAAGLGAPRIELLRIRLLTAAQPVLSVRQKHAPFLAVKVSRQIELRVIRRQRADARLYVDGRETIAVRGVAAGHGRRRVAVDVQDHRFPFRLQLGEDEAQPADDLAHHVVHRSADVQVEIRLDAKLFQHAAAQVLVVMLAGVSEQHRMTPFLQLLVERNLLDDVGLRGDQDQMNIGLRHCRDAFEEVCLCVADTLHDEQSVVDFQTCCTRTVTPTTASLEEWEFP